MKYATAQGFREALESRLKRARDEEGLSIDRLRKQVAFERFIARLLTIQPDAWILKGGLSMQLRLGSKTRTTRDIDFLYQAGERQVPENLANAAGLDLGDWFKFQILGMEEDTEDVYGGQRFNVQCLLDDRTFENFHIDVGVDDQLLGEADQLQFPPFLEFAGLQAISVPSYSATQQIAEKAHALTRDYATGGSTRIKDLIDILLLATLNEIDGSKLRHDIQATFDRRASHEIPPSIPLPRAILTREYNRLARELELDFANMTAATEALALFINPILTGDVAAFRWDNEAWAWILD